MSRTSDIRAGLVGALSKGLPGVKVYASMPSRLREGKFALIVLAGEQLAVFGQSAGSQPSRSVTQWSWRVLAAVPQSAAGAQGILDNLVDRVPDAIESDRTLGGKARSVTCTGVRELDDTQIAGGRYLVATFDVAIITHQQASSTPDGNEEDSR